MKIHLDHSHFCLVENWSTYQRMKRCDDDLDNYVVESAHACAEDLKRRYGSRILLEQGKLEKDRWFNVTPAILAKLPENLFTIGIEGLRLESLICAGDDACVTYLWSERGHKTPNSYFPDLDEVIRRLPVPKGHTEAPKGSRQGGRSWDDGYWYTGLIGPLSAKQVYDQTEFKGHLTEGLIFLLEWFFKHQQKLVAAVRF